MTTKSVDRDHDHQYSTFICGCCGEPLVVPISCGNRFCSICNKSRSSRIRKRANFLMNNIPLESKYSFKFLTLSIPNMINPHDQLTELRKSFRRLRQRQWWKELVRGGCVFYEVKTGSDKRYHIHLHAIIESAYLPFDDLKEMWSEVSPGSAVHIKWLSDKAVVGYVVKYTTKSDLSLKDQLIASKMLKGSRLFQTFGSWHDIGLKYVHEPFQCPDCLISDWIYYPSDGDVFKTMWKHGHEPPYIPKNIFKQFQTELGLKHYQSADSCRY